MQEDHDRGIGETQKEVVAARRQRRAEHARGVTAIILSLAAIAVAIAGLAHYHAVSGQNAAVSRQEQGDVSTIPLPSFSHRWKVHTARRNMWFCIENPVNDSLERVIRVGAGQRYATFSVTGHAEWLNIGNVFTGNPFFFSYRPFACADRGYHQ